ncbi:MAG: LSU ribosomal protein L10p (P0) [uncultured Solirubrobacteraceae bacterium]|uniref:Large ribosomal subunit protein uL10 n=1 Tax=uncultured Solirubrobacteraceae bacterium TaxID=1162706 RepID=A0A6J4SYL2_9ACTN|nr:MAG: LSU ribosomal protein L10p (P0) [uncultured Solirubrobacteraceae bacterium]
MNRNEKAAVIDEIADQIRESEAVFAVDYRGISVPQAAGLRETLRGSESTFRVTKNTLTVLAADKAEQEALKDFLSGPTALTFVKGDAASAAKAIADFQRAQPDLLPFKGGTLNGAAIDAAQLGALAKLPTREVLYQQLVGIVASPISGLARTLNALIGGLAIQLGQINEKKQSGEIAADADPPAAAAPAAEAPADDPDPAPAADEQPDESTKDDQDAEAPAAPTTSDAPAEGADDASTTPTESEEN